jgi:hypothetical protein
MEAADPYSQRQFSDHDRFLWTVTAQIVSGIVANPARAQLSVADTMNLFEVVLEDVDALVRERGIGAAGLPGVWHGPIQVPGATQAGGEFFGGEKPGQRQAA